MENSDIQSTDYKVLINNGLRLAMNDFNLIRDSLVGGAQEAMKYLNVQNDTWPKFNFSNDIPSLGYSSATDAICLSINHLNQADTRSTTLEFKDQLLMFIPDVFYIIVKYTFWLKLLGIESTIHRYQKIGNPLLFTQFPLKLTQPYTSRQLLLSNFEVEARKITDEITLQLGENQIWKNVDDYFAKNYTEYYNKSIEEIAKLPKPTFPISYEMEFYTI